jgi:ATP-dependent Lhr-like helicase
MAGDLAIGPVAVESMRGMLSSDAYRTLERWIRHAAKEELGIVSTGGISPYFLTVQIRKHAVEELRQRIISLRSEEIEGEELVDEAEAPQLQKYDEFVPPTLLRKAFAADCLDTGKMQTEMAGWR